MNKTIFKQLDSRWADLPYPNKKSLFGGNGCGCCACVHVAIEQSEKKNWTPKKLRPWMVKQGYAISGQGTTWNGITETLKHIGHSKVVKVWDADPMSDAWKELNKGNRIGIILFNSNKAPNGTRWTASGHYVAFTDYKVKNGKHYFYCKDSGGRNHDGWFTYERSMKGCIPKLWIVERIKPVTIAPTTTTASNAKSPKAKSANAQKIVDMATKFCWKKGTPRKKWKIQTGKPKKAYKKALKKYMKKKAKISQTDCGYFVNTCVRAAGLGKDFKALPGSPSESYPKVPKTMKAVHKGGKIPDGFLQPGDIITYRRKGNRQHALMYYKKGQIAEAGRGSKFPAIHKDTKKYNGSTIKKDSIRVLRAR